MIRQIRVDDKDLLQSFEDMIVGDNITIKRNVDFKKKRVEIILTNKCKDELILYGCD